MINEQIYSKHYTTIDNLYKEMGVDALDNYLKKDLLDITKKVITIREKLDEKLNQQRQAINSDHINHLKLDIDEIREELNILLKDLIIADERYICYKEYVKRKNY